MLIIYRSVLSAAVAFFSSLCFAAVLIKGVLWSVSATSCTVWGGKYKFTLNL